MEARDKASSLVNDPLGLFSPPVVQRSEKHALMASDKSFRIDTRVAGLPIPPFQKIGRTLPEEILRQQQL
jgi:hypothetical protein